MVASCHVKDALSAMTMLFSFLEIKKKLKQAGNNWWLLNVISENGKTSMFSKVAENMMADYIQSIQTAPDGVVTEIYPEAGNEDGKIDLILF